MMEFPHSVARAAHFAPSPLRFVTSPAAPAPAWSDSSARPLDSMAAWSDSVASPFDSVVTDSDSVSLESI